MILAQTRLVTANAAGCDCLACHILRHALAGQIRALIRHERETLPPVPDGLAVLRINRFLYRRAECADFN